MEATENRFAHLLQPIRELTKNWEIDVASELNDYLEELDEVCITFDGGKTSVNFAEAALLIQGTACIYSKKVELLHSLVYQTLEYINFNKKRRNKEASASEEDDGALSHHHADDMDEFTLLDLEASGNCQSSDCSSTVSVTPLPPESLIPPEACEKLKLPLISVKGEVLCSQKDFRINQFLPGDEDLILLTLRSAAAHFLLAHHHHHHHHHPLHPPADSVIQQQQQQQQQQQPAAGDEDDGGGVAEDNMEVDDDTEQVDRHQAVTEARLFRERRQVEGDTQRKGEELLPSVDVWRFHDLYAVVGEDRPFKPGKCYKVPDGLEDRGKRKRRRGVSLQDFRTWFTGT
ncbi:condensin-2 complex subunit H2-like, partial [Brachyistius frenatus]|uniref:condensin-2 complex subunit H2-like n=1 Tax=Brachyistius frenatus TaxID=100188 RepID=UPI0037E9B5B9